MNVWRKNRFLKEKKISILLSMLPPVVYSRVPFSVTWKYKNKSEELYYIDAKHNILKLAQLYTLKIRHLQYIFCLSVCLFVCLLLQNKRQNGWIPIGPNCIYCISPPWPKGRFMNAQNIKKFSPKNLDFYKSLKIYVIIILNLPANLFCFVLFCTKRRCLQIEPQLNIEI